MIEASALEAVTPQELAKAATLFDTVKKLRQKLKDIDEGYLDQAFENHVQGVLDKLAARLPIITEKHSKKVEVTMAKHGLYDAAFQQVVLLCQNISPALGETLKDLRSIHSTFMTDLQQSVCDFISESKQQTDDLIKVTKYAETLESNVKTLQETLEKLNKEADVHEKKILQLRQHLREAAQEINYVRDINASDSKGLFNTTSSFDNMSNVYGQPGNTPNKRNQRKISKSRSYEEFNTSVNGLNSEVGSPPRYAQQLKRILDGSNGGKRGKEWNVDPALLDDSYDPLLASGPRSKASVSISTPGRSTLSVISPINWLRSFRVDVQRAIDDKRCRNITIHECRDLMDKVWESKLIANEKSLTGVSNLPMETLEQHLFRNMEKKYGLRSLAVDHVGMFIQALYRYQHDEYEISVFLKIFQNEIEEDFKVVHAELYNSIQDLYLMQLLHRYPNRDESTLRKFIEQKMENGFILEEEWKDIIKYLYNENDSSTLLVLLRNLAVEERNKEIQNEEHENIKTHGREWKIPRSVTPLSSVNSKYAKIRKGGTNYVLGSTPVKHTKSKNNESGEIVGYDKNDPTDVKRLGYSSNTLQIRWKESKKDENNVQQKDPLKIPYIEFIRAVLDYHLSKHELFLKDFLKVFRKVDTDVDGVLNAKEFHELFILLKRHTQHMHQFGNDVNFNFNQVDHSRESSDEVKQFLLMLKEVDPLETDRVIYSSAVLCYKKWKQEPVEPLQKIQEPEPESDVSRLLKSSRRKRSILKE